MPTLWSCFLENTADSENVPICYSCLTDLPNQVKCAQYWPSRDREAEIFEEFIVKLNSEDHCPDYTIRHLSLTNVSSLDKLVEMYIVNFSLCVYTCVSVCK